MGREVTRIVDANRKTLPRGSFVTIRGQCKRCAVLTSDCWAGSSSAIVLVYLLIVVNFQSWLDPFIIITALPAALAGIVGFLFFTHTTLSVPALMGAIMCMGVGNREQHSCGIFRERAACCTTEIRSKPPSKPASPGSARC